MTGRYNAPVESTMTFCINDVNSGATLTGPKAALAPIDVFYAAASVVRSEKASLLCSPSRGEAQLSACSASSPSARKGHGCAGLGVERETTVDQTLIRGLVTAFRVFVSGLSSV